MLGANHFFLATGGATIALDSETGGYLLQRNIQFSVLDVGSFVKLIEGFVNKLEELKNLVAEFRPAFEKADKVIKAERQEAIRLGLNGFMQV